MSPPWANSISMTEKATAPIKVHHLNSGSLPTSSIPHQAVSNHYSTVKMWCRWPYKDGRSLRPLLPLYPSPAICQPCHVREGRAISEYQPRESHLIADLIPMIRRLQYGYNRAQRFRTEKISFGGSLHKHQKSKAFCASTGHRPRNLMVWSASRAQPSHTSARTPLTPVHELTNEKRGRC